MEDGMTQVIIASEIHGTSKKARPFPDSRRGKLGKKLLLWRELTSQNDAK
jgi:hypothetical protein